MFNSEKKDIETNDYIKKLNQMLEYEKEKKKSDPVKITICIVGGIGSVMFIAILCYSILKSELSIDSILSTLLAFFSIFISIFFYFKADETSTNFYNSSYEFMKDISVTLGKIEERFGEKLNSLNDKVSHLDRISNETSEEIKDKTNDKDSIINKLMEKANLSEEEKEKYREELAEKDTEIERLKNQKYIAERRAKKLRNRISEIEDIEDDLPIPPKSFLERLLHTHDTSDVSSRGMYTLRKLGIINADGYVNEPTILDILDKYNA